MNGVPHALLAIQDTYAMLKRDSLVHEDLFRSLDYAYALELLNLFCIQSLKIVYRS